MKEFGVNEVSEVNEVIDNSFVADTMLNAASNCNVDNSERSDNSDYSDNFKNDSANSAKFNQKKLCQTVNHSEKFVHGRKPMSSYWRSMPRRRCSQTMRSSHWCRSFNGLP